MAATTELDDVDDKEDVCRTTAVALPQPTTELDEILDARKRPAGCATILGDVMLLQFAWLYCMYDMI